MLTFISSTCYDLIDLRAELEEFLRDRGIDVILSDSLTSDFEVPANCNSIEACLANVRRCDDFLVILSGRYGCTLEKFGYGGISATHLEYREAKKAGKRIHMYVRDRLESEFVIWKKSKEKPPELGWCKSTADHKIFQLLEEHRAGSVVAESTNWFWTFRNSVELKKRISADFKSQITQVTLKRLWESGRLPVLELKTRFDSLATGFCRFDIELRNLGSSVALSPLLKFEGTASECLFDSLFGQSKTLHKQGWHVKFNETILPTSLSFSVLEGHRFTDVGEIIINRQTSSVSYKLKERRYSGLDPNLSIIIHPKSETS